VLTGKTETRGRRRLRCLQVLLLAGLAACGGASGAALDRGDKYAEAGLWDKAAAEYEQALRLDPKNTDAAIKLKQVRGKLSAERLARGRSLIQRGEIESGLAAIQEAVRLDPESAEAQKALTDANAAALARAEQLLAGPDPTRALAITTLVLVASPNDPRAREMDGRVRDSLAERAYARAEEFAAAGKRGNALVEYAAAETYRPDYKDAKLHIGELKLALRKELTFVVVLEPFAADPRAPDLSATLSPDLLAQSFDERLPLRVQRSAPRGAEGGGPRGVRLSGRFDGYAFDPRRETEPRTCQYVCRTEMRPNPEHDRAEQGVASAERRLAQAEEEVARYQKDVDRYQHDVDEAMKEVTRQEQEVDRARAEYEKCRDRATQSGSGSTSSSPCSSEESRYRSEQSDLESARRRLESPQGWLSSARDQLSRASESRTSARRDRDRELETMRTTPRDIEVPVNCDYNYNVAVHTLKAGVTVRISVENLAERTKVLDDEPFQFAVQHRDETFPAQPGRCPEVAQGKRLHLPSEKAVRQALVNKAIAGIREKVLGTYDRYRQRFLADARREEAAGLAEEAVEAYVRYVLTGVKSIDPKDQKQIADFLSKTRGFGKLDQLGSL
jgi:tetratricopeptide (TPR) repeat protein